MNSETRALFSTEQLGLSEKDLIEIWENFHSSTKASYFRPVHVTGRVRPFAKNRIGYLGDHFLLELESEGAEGMVLFMKTTISNIPALNKYLELVGTDRKELNMYCEIIPKLSKFSKFAPDCFLTSKHSRLLVLENLQNLGFRNIQNTAGIFDKEHLQCALVALAKFHSASLLLERQSDMQLPMMAPGVLDENVWIRKENNPRIDELNNAIDVLLAMVRIIEKDNPQLNTILAKLPAFIEQIYDLVKPSRIYQNVACHGDLWANNVMFRYDITKAGQAPVEALIVDFQFTRYAPPAYDVNMLITLTTTGEFRRVHYDQLISFYYQQMLKELRKHSSTDVVTEAMFDEMSFYESCSVYRVSGLIDNFLMNHVTLLPRSHADRIFSSAENYSNFSGKAKIQMCVDLLKQDNIYRDRVTGIIKDLIKEL